MLTLAHSCRFSVAVGSLPAVEPGRPARRRKRSSTPTQRAGKFQHRTHLPPFFPGGPSSVAGILRRVDGTPALYGRRDFCRYNAFAAFSRVTANYANANWNCHRQLDFTFSGHHVTGNSFAAANRPKRSASTGSTSRLSSVEVTKPPRIAMAIGPSISRPASPEP